MTLCCSQKSDEDRRLPRDHRQHQPACLGDEALRRHGRRDLILNFRLRAFARKLKLLFFALFLTFQISCSWHISWGGGEEVSFCVSLLLRGPNLLTRYSQSAYSSEMVLGQAFGSFPALGSSSGKTHAGTSVGACRDTRLAAAPAELSARSQDTSRPGRELGTAQHYCTGPRARGLSLDTDAGLAPLAC